MRVSGPLNERPLYLSQIHNTQFRPTVSNHIRRRKSVLTICNSFQVDEDVLQCLVRFGDCTERWSNFWDVRRIGESEPSEGQKWMQQKLQKEREERIRKIQERHRERMRREQEQLTRLSSYEEEEAIEVDNDDDTTTNDEDFDDEPEFVDDDDDEGRIHSLIEFEVRIYLYPDFNLICCILGQMLQNLGSKSEIQPTT